MTWACLGVKAARNCLVKEKVEGEGGRGEEDDGKGGNLEGKKTQKPLSPELEFHLLSYLGFGAWFSH